MSSKTNPPLSENLSHFNRMINSPKFLDVRKIFDGLSEQDKNTISNETLKTVVFESLNSSNASAETGYRSLEICRFISDPEIKAKCVSYVARFLSIENLGIENKNQNEERGKRVKSGEEEELNDFLKDNFKEDERDLILSIFSRENFCNKIYLPQFSRQLEKASKCASFIQDLQIKEDLMKQIKVQQSDQEIAQKIVQLSKNKFHEEFPLLLSTIKLNTLKDNVCEILSSKFLCDKEYLLSLETIRNMSDNNPKALFLKEFITKLFLVNDSSVLKKQDAIEEAVNTILKCGGDQSDVNDTHLSTDVKQIIRDRNSLRFRIDENEISILNFIINKIKNESIRNKLKNLLVQESITD